MIGPKHWQAIYGKFEFSPDEVRFQGELLPPPSGADNVQPMASLGIAMSDTRFSGGTIEFDVNWQNVNSIPTVHSVSVQRGHPSNRGFDPVRDMTHKPARGGPAAAFILAACGDGAAECAGAPNCVSIAR